MKLNKFILGTAIAAALVSSATAADNTATIDITGATAFRSSTHSSILAVLDSETYAYTGGTLGSAAQAIFKGNLGVGGTPVIIRTSFSGSAEGIQALTSGANVNFLSAVEGTQPTTSGGTSGATAGTDPASADLALSDVYQSSTNFPAPPLVGSIVAVVPFKFVVSQGGGPAGVTNVTNQLFRVLYSNGLMPLSLWTGNPVHEGNFMYASGRDGGSGTRITALAETRYGINVEVAQNTGTINTSTDTVTALTFAGNGGYSSGGTLAGLLGAQAFTTQGGYILGYLGLPDAATATAATTAGGAHDCAYNGVTYSAADVYNGKYTFWGYEHLYSLSATPGNNVGAVRDALVTQIGNNPGAAGLDPDNMRVLRETDGADVGPAF